MENLSISAICNDLEQTVTHILRSRQYSTLNVLITAQDSAYAMENE